MSEQLLKLAKEKMEKVISSYENELKKWRTGGANPNLLSHIHVDYYGTPTPIFQVASVTSPDSHQIVIKPYERNSINLIVGAISKSDLGFTPFPEGDLIRIKIPQLTEERRNQMVKEMRKETENFKITIRNERRDFKEKVKKNTELSKDNKTHYENKLQNLTDEYIEIIDQKAKVKEKELLTV